jgi:hypothetical protein
VPRPKPWQHREDKHGIREAKRNPYAARASADVEVRLGATKPADPPMGAG